MAGPLVVPGMIFAVYYDMLYLNQQVLTTFHYRVGATSPGTSDLTTFLTAFRAEFSEIAGPDAAFADLFTTDVSQIKMSIQCIHPTRYIRSVGFANPSVGTRLPGEAILPANLAAAVTFRSLLAGPHEHGTKHILVTKSEDVTNGVVQEEFRDLILVFAEFMKNQIVTEAPAADYVMIPIIFNRADPGTSKDIEDVQVQTTSRIMRRRTVGLGT